MSNPKPSKRRPPWIRPRVEVDPLRARINGNSPQGRRVRRRWRQYLAELVSPDDPLQRTFASDCAELHIAIEDMQARQVAGENCAAHLVRLRNELRRAEGKLQLKGQEKPTNPSASAAERTEWLNSFKKPATVDGVA